MEKGKIKTTDEGVKIVCADGSVVADLGWEKFPDLYGNFLNGKIYLTDKDTLDIEKIGEQLRENGGDFISFFERIKKWGGDTRCFIEMNTKRYGTSKEEIAEAIRCATGFLQKKEAKKKDIEDAFNSVTEPKGLGMSYGSKVLRMLSPQHVGVYDLVLQKHLLYKANADGYADFCLDCKKVADKLNDKNVEKPKGGEWRVADVEAALFFHFYMLKKQ